MIGHYLLSLTPEQEDRVLVGRFEGYKANLVDQDAQCLLDVVVQVDPSTSVQVRECIQNRLHRWPIPPWDISYVVIPLHVGTCYDRLCRRFGVPRVNNAIRGRILTNKLWRARTLGEACFRAYEFRRLLTTLFEQGSPVQ